MRGRERQRPGEVGQTRRSDELPMMIGFSTIDWWIVGIYVLLAAVPGFLCRKYIFGQADFLIAGRTLSVFLATATLTATEMGLITVMYMAEFSYLKGFSGMVVGLLALSATLFVGLTGVIVRGLRQSGVTTVAEYYEMRYSRGVRLLGGVVIATAGILNYGVFLKIEAEFIRIITGVPDFELRVASDPNEDSGTSAEGIEAASTRPAGQASETTQEAENPPDDHTIRISSIKLVMTVLLVIVLLYTLMGGMVSVALTDYIQFIVLTLGMAGATYWVMTQSGIGGFGGMVEAVKEHRPEYGFNPLIMGETASGVAVGVGLVWVIWQSMHWLGSNTWQTQAFRTAAADSPSTARKMWIFTAFNFFGRAIIPMVWGLGALAYLGANPPGGESVQAMPTFLANLPAGLVGFLMAGMLAALMSTHSSYLLAWSGVLTEDIVAPLMKVIGWEVPQGWRIWITRFFILCLGAFLLFFGLWYKTEGAVWNYLAMTGTIYIAGSITLVAMGLYWKRANTTGAYCGVICGALPGLIYLILRITAMVIEPGITETGHEPSHFIAVCSSKLSEPVVGVISYPLALAGMILGSMWGGRHAAGAPVPRPEPAPALEAAAAGGGS